MQVTDSDLVRGEGGMHAIEDALKLSEALGQIDLTDPNAITTAIAGYHAEALGRGAEAVKKSRAPPTGDKGSVPMVWGHSARPIPEATVSLSSSK